MGELRLRGQKSLVEPERLAEALGRMLAGAAAGVVCFFAATKLKRKFGYDDSLDVFGVHAVGGIVGALLTGVFAASAYGGAGLPEGVSVVSQLCAPELSSRGKPRDLGFDSHFGSRDSSRSTARNADLRQSARFKSRSVSVVIECVTTLSPRRQPRWTAACSAPSPERAGPAAGAAGIARPPGAGEGRRRLRRARRRG